MQSANTFHVNAALLSTVLRIVSYNTEKGSTEWRRKNEKWKEELHLGLKGKFGNMEAALLASSSCNEDEEETSL